MSRSKHRVSPTRTAACPWDLSQGEGALGGCCRLLAERGSRPNLACALTDSLVSAHHHASTHFTLATKCQCDEPGLHRPWLTCGFRWSSWCSRLSCTGPVTVCNVVLVFVDELGAAAIFEASECQVSELLASASSVS